MSFGSDTPGGSVEGIGGREEGIGSYDGGSEARSAEALFRQKIDPYMSAAYGPIANTATKLGGYALSGLMNTIMPGLGTLSSLTGVSSSAANAIRDSIVANEISNIMGLGGKYNSVPEVVESAYKAGKSEQDIANAYNTVSKRRGGVMGLWEDITGKSAAKAATGAAGTAASYQQQAIDYLKQMGAIPLAAQQGLAGIYGLPGGTGSQQQTIDQIQASPMYSTMMQSGEDAIMRKAGATGGLRSGNVQDALARYSGDVMSNLYQQQLQGLTGLAGMGTYAGDIAGGLGTMGQTLAAGQTAAAQAQQQGTSNLLGLAGSVYQGIGGWSGIKDIGSGIASAIGSLF